MSDKKSPPSKKLMMDFKRKQHSDRQNLPQIPSLNAFPGLNLTTFFAAMVIASPV